MLMTGRCEAAVAEVEVGADPAAVVQLASVLHLHAEVAAVEVEIGSLHDGTKKRRSYDHTCRHQLPFLATLAPNRA